jgi:hypothetical protein
VKEFRTGDILVLNPTILAAQNRDRVSVGDQMFRQKLTVRQRTVNVSTGGDLKDVQGFLGEMFKRAAAINKRQCTDHRRIDAMSI